MNCWKRSRMRKISRRSKRKRRRMRRRKKKRKGRRRLGYGLGVFQRREEHILGRGKRYPVRGR